MPLTSKKQVITIGIFGSNGKKSTLNMLTNIFCSAGLIVKTFSSKNNVMNNGKLTNIETYKELKKAGNNDIIIIEITEDYLKNNSLDDIGFDILLHCNISEGSYEHSKEGIAKINSIINFSNGTKVVILNTDDIMWKDIVIDLQNTYLITYGLGIKATVTASSIECSRIIKFCYCLQRSLCTLNEEVIEPMEVPFSINVPGHCNVYNALAAITAALICNVHADTIKYGLSSCNNKIQNYGLRVLYEDSFGVVDNTCDTVLSFETGFEAVQHLRYKRVHLLFNLNTVDSYSINYKIIDIIATWSLILNITHIYYLQDTNSIIDPNFYDRLKKVMSNSDIYVTRIVGRSEDMDNLFNSISDNDLLLIFCSSKIHFLRDMIKESLDKHILGKLTEDSNKFF